MHPQKGALAQLARVLDWQSRGHRFDSDMLHTKNQVFTKQFVKAFLSSVAKSVANFLTLIVSIPPTLSAYGGGF